MATISVTVAAVLQQDSRFLMVEELTDEGMRINQPAGHLESGESILQAALRETLEESAYHFEPRTLIGVYRWHHSANDVTYVRFAVSGDIGACTGRALDQGILRALWLTADELRECLHLHRSPLVMRCVDDYLAGRCYPLDLLVDLL